MVRIDFTVAIRAYNAAQRLPLLLQKLQFQQNTESIRWEILVVDNNSTDNTAEVVQTYQSQLSQLRYILETQQGAAIARKRAITEAQGTWIGFLDDDTLPAPDWVAQAYKFGQTHPKVGAFGSRILPEYEIEPPKNFDRIAHYMPIMLKTQSFCYDTHLKGMPVGAGLVIRKQAWLESAIGDQIIQGPVKQGFALKGEETEVLWKMKSFHWEIWYNAEMTIAHKIPQWRLEKDYLLNFLSVIGLSQHRFRMLRYPVWKRPIAFPFLLINDLRKVVLSWHKHQQSNDLIDACELQFFMGRLLSPFYIWKRLLLQHLASKQEHLS
ncbi:hormogonium polysaccharide biosynthesis glycosyltransferase HpsE [Leptolyngbya sp. GGD]|uniref:hormogonium polysaccharide biosynthesis glycosyltransferase HpsE n=1 Tax=Leptolyngbya sp. GGD TaxID=2997907 RepID=UPI00227BE0C0|nr:hormogonium polysaccharide biosynthesis glycosyltransferase HpsE [Leptolyngbya sp. GGD]MCY6491891.1 hormogonium polysaccharide biosynthesis glycosyltransferase HpsE [Leptolyngbya sp. GGD]